MSGYRLSDAARAQAAAWDKSRAVAIKGTWTPETRPVAFSDRDNFTTNRVTVADYMDMAARGNALGLSATYACVNLIAGTGASLSASIYFTKDGVRREAVEHPLYWLLRMDPNFEQSDFEFWEFCHAAIELSGNFYARKIRNTGGVVVALEPVARPDLVDVRRNDRGERVYRWTEDANQMEVGEDDILHIRGFGGTRLKGASTLSVCGQAFYGALATERAASAMFGNGARPSGVLSTELRLTGEQRDELEGALREKFVGAINAGRPMLLDGGLKWEQLTINPVDAQMLESRKFSGEEVCRLFGVPPAMVGYGDKASNWGTGREQEVLGFVKFTLRKRLRRVEKALMKQLLTRAERQGGYSIEFNIEGLLRGDSAGRAAFYQIMVRLGVMTRNEVRRLENMAPIEGGDVATVQMQDVPLPTAISGDNQQ